MIKEIVGLCRITERHEGAAFPGSGNMLVEGCSVNYLSSCTMLTVLWRIMELVCFLTFYRKT